MLLEFGLSHAQISSIVTEIISKKCLIHKQVKLIFTKFTLHFGVALISMQAILNWDPILVISL